MTTVLNDHSMEEMDKFYEENGTTLGAISKNGEATEMWIEKLKNSARRDDILPFEWISWMLEQAPSERPTADQLLGRILDTRSDHAFLCSNCLADAHSSQAERIARNGLPDEAPIEAVTEILVQSFLQHDSPSQSAQESEFMRQEDHTLNEHDDAVTAVILAKANTWEPSKEGNHISVSNAGTKAKSNDSKCIVGFVQSKATERKPDPNDNELVERTRLRNVRLEGPSEYVNRSEAKASSRPLSNVVTGDGAQGNEL